MQGNQNFGYLKANDKQVTACRVRIICCSDQNHATKTFISHEIAEQLKTYHALLLLYCYYYYYYLCYHDQQSSRLLDL